WRSGSPLLQAPELPVRLDVRAGVAGRDARRQGDGGAHLDAQSLWCGMRTERPLALAESLDRLGTESAFAVLARARELERQGREVIHLEIGEPYFDTPAHVTEAAVEALRAGETHYCPSAGIPELREAAAEYLASSRRIAVEPGRVLVATGAKPFLFFTVLAVCDPGDEVIYPDPGFPIYESAVRFAGAVPVPLPLHEERDFVFDLD